MQEGLASLWATWAPTWAWSVGVGEPVGNVGAHVGVGRGLQ